MTNLDKLIKDFKEARAAASKGPWQLYKDKDGDAERIFARDITGCDENDDTYNEVGVVKLPVEKYGYGCAWASEPNGEFICLSANKSDRLLRIIEVMGIAIDKHHLTWSNQDGSCSSECSRLCKALQQVEEIAREK